MIERVYIDNYKCFVNFEIQPQAIQLILGGNGSGKTTFFDVLETVRDFLTEGNTTSQSFPTSTLKAWDKRRTQRFELAIKGNDGIYQYLLETTEDDGLLPAEIVARGWEMEPVR
jgi:AAA15 family ATPase/GTPase